MITLTDTKSKEIAGSSVCLLHFIDRRFKLAALLALTSLPATTVSVAQQPPQVTTLSAARAITNAEAARNIPVTFEGTVIYYEKGNTDLFVQDGDDAIYASAPLNLAVKTGDRVLVEGNMQASFRPEVSARRVSVLHHGAPPKAVEASFAQLIRAELDCRRVKVRAVVRSANVISDGTGKSLLLDLLMPGGYLQAQVAAGGTQAQLHALLDSEVELTGAAAGRFDSKSQMTGVLLEIPEFSDIHYLHRPAIDPYRIPIRPFDQILQASHLEDRSERVRVQGIITYYQPGSALVLQDGESALWVDTLSEEPHQIGDKVIVSGFPDVRNGSVVLTRADVERTEFRAPLPIKQVDVPQLASGSHASELVSVEGELVMQVREAAADEYVLLSQGHVFSAFYRHPERGLNIPVSPMQKIRPGAHVRITGICVLDRGDQFAGPVAFHILLRSSSDVVVVAGPPLVSVRNLGYLLGFLLIVIFIVTGKALLLERSFHRQAIATAASAERWRSRIIDGINNAIPLPETLLQITELLAFELQAKYCWAEIDGAGTFGNRPPDSDKSRMQTIEQTIPARSGATLGKICVALPVADRRRSVTEVLDNKLRLAALAIETGGEYSDLVRRSEIDSLTEAQNRFAFERALDLAIDSAMKASSRFGLIYLDLDRFKQVNDQYGHNIGDRYLQEVVSRIRHQLRPSDVLARIGGDEFAVLIGTLKSEEELREIGTRLQGCFSSPFSFDKCEIKGTASIGTAIFPDDATTREDLFEAADVKMYEVKHQKRQGPIRIPATPDTESRKKNNRFGT